MGSCIQHNQVQHLGIAECQIQNWSLMCTEIGSVCVHNCDAVRVNDLVCIVLEAAPI